MAVRSALHQAGAVALGELLRFPVPPASTWQANPVVSPEARLWNSDAAIGCSGGQLLIA